MKTVMFAVSTAALVLGACATLPIGGGGVPEAALGRWTLVSANRADAVPGSNAYIEVAADRLNGRSGCNSFGVPLTRTANGVNFGPGQMTMMACSEPLMDQENSLMSVFEGQGQITVSAEGQLVIIGGRGSSAVFSRAE